MEAQRLDQLKSRNPDQIVPILEQFNDKNASLFDFAQFHVDGQWQKLWDALFVILGAKDMSAQHALCLSSVRILTRDEFSLQTADVISDLDCLLRLAELSEEFEQTMKVDPDAESQAAEDEAALEGAAAVVGRSASTTETIVEALKCICNLVYQSPGIRRHCMRHNITDVLLKRVTSSSQQTLAIELYDLKLLFLMTALEPTARVRMQIDLNAIAYMTEWLDEKLVYGPLNNDNHLDVLCEMLKCMFNITTNPDKSPNENEIQSLHLTGVIRVLLVRFSGMHSDKERLVFAHAINLLTNMSSICLIELITKVGADEQSATIPAPTQMLVFEGWNVRVIDSLLRYLHMILEEQQNTACSPEAVPPVLVVLVKCARCNSTMRHFIRSIVLPPLRDVGNRPEVGNELRNHLCRFLTMPAMVVRDLAAELLFVCCKENVGRMIKYTGYGNAAGLFANRGILDCRRVESADYSSDSEDSDTEEYKQLQHAINPVVGCLEPTPKTDAFAGMTDEQKEHEAMELVKLMDQLHRSGIVQPCRVGEDGKPQPVDHILQLQEELPQQQIEQKRKT